MALQINQFQPNEFTSLYGLHTASTADWARLVYALRNDPAINARQLQVNLNEAGEYTGWAYSDIATFVYGGGIWVEWCGWPMAITDFTAPYGAGDFQVNFQHLLEAMDVSGGYQAGPVSFSAVPPGWPYTRSLVSTGPVQGKGFEVNPNALNESFGNNQYVYSSFAIRYGEGAYLYAFANSNSYGLADRTGQVPYSQYWPFIQKVIHEVISYRLTSSSGPGCTRYGTYKGEMSGGNFIYERTQGVDTIRTIVDSQCTPIPGPGAVTIVKAPTQSGSGSSSGPGGSGRGLCNGFGTYVGPGNMVGSSDAYDAYKTTTATGYTYNIVDPTSCRLIDAFAHTTPVSSSSGGSAGGGSSGGGSSSGATSIQPSSQPAAPSASGANFFSTKNVLLLGGGLAAAGGLYYYLTRRQ